MALAWYWVALILFGWRRYVDLQHEAEMRAEQELRATVLATTDPITGLYNRKGFAERAGQLCADAGQRRDHLVVISFQIHRFKSVNDQHGYEIGDRLLKTLSVALADALGTEAVLARLGGETAKPAVAAAKNHLGLAIGHRVSGTGPLPEHDIFARRGIPPNDFAGFLVDGNETGRLRRRNLGFSIAVIHAVRGANEQQIAGN